MPTLLPIEIAHGLYQAYCLREAVASSSALENLVSYLIFKNSSELDHARNGLRDKIKNIYSLEIFKNLRYAPHDKIALDYGKCLVEVSYQAGKRYSFE